MIRFSHCQQVHKSTIHAEPTKMTCFASLGDEIKVWDAINHSLEEHLRLDCDNVTDICWNHDGVVLAAAKKDDSVNLRQFDGSKAVSSHSFTLSDSHSLCLEYDSSSRYLACGCNNGTLQIFDTYSMKMYKSFQGHKFPITSLCWNWNDKNIALGSKHGEVFLYNVITGQASSPFKPVSSVAIQQLMYNPYRKASLISADAMGVIALWDTNTRGHLHSFASSHKAPASDLAFSPVNDYLMLSVGLDKRLIFYNMQNKSVINTITADYPLTCVDMLDGGKIAVGTSRGKILIYDMRMSSLPMSTLHAHKSSVRRIIFNKKDEVTASSSFLQPVPTETAPVHQNNEGDENQNQNDHWKAVSLTSDKLSSSVISSLKDDSNASGLSESNLSAFRSHHSFLNQILGHTDDSGRNVSTGQHGSAKNSFITSSPQRSHDALPRESAAVAGFLSPCQDDSSLSDSSLNMSFLMKQNRSFIRQILGAAGSRDVSTLPGGQVSSPPRETNRETEQDSLREDDVDSQNVFNSPREQRNRPLSKAKTNSAGLDLENTDLHQLKDVVKDIFADMKEEMKADIKIMMGQRSSGSSLSGLESHLLVGNSREGVALQGDLFRQIIREELMDFEDRMHKDHLNISFGVHRMIYRLQMIIQQGFQELAINPALVEEIERLKREMKHQKYLY